LFIEDESTDLTDSATVSGTLQRRREGEKGIAHAGPGRTTEEVRVNGVKRVLAKGGDRAVLAY
jgi:hypothetical protein